MAKYQGAYREDVYKEDTPEVTPEVNETSEQVQESSEEATFKKRYGDLRRHMQQSMAQKDAELKQMQEQLAQATKKQIKFPKTEEEVQAWASKYPDVAKIIDTIAQKRVQEAMAIGERELGKVKQLETRLEKERATQELRKLHPDFDKLRRDPAFHEWVAEQPTYVRDALYKNETDARAASRAIDLYKADKGIRRPKGNAAESVSRGSSQGAPSTGKARFKESQVQKMSAAEYEKNEEAIFQAMKEGNFEYDLSGGAR